MLHSIYDLTTFCRKTTGDVPAKLVGASTTVVGSKMYLFGGRLVTERRMVSELYVFDLESFNWEKVPVSSEDDVPQARYFHSADAWNNHLIIFGGMSNQPDSPNPDELCVLNDVRFFDLTTRHWLPAAPSPLVPPPDSPIPRARYAHLSSVTADRLFIIGGQDFFNTWLDDVCVFDLVSKTWVQRRDYPRHCGTYRSVAVASNMCVRLPQEELRASQSTSTLGPAGTRFNSDRNALPTPDVTPPDSLVHLPYSATPSEDHPSDIYLYSNYNFTDVKRELEVFSPLPDNDFTIQDRSAAMTGATFPPGLRFPTGAILGTHLIIAGTYLAHSYQSFSIWVLDLLTMKWSRIDPGKAVESGSWFRGCLWAESNKFLIFGNRNGNLVDDYNRRLLSWDHVAVVDLEAFGIYQPPTLKVDIRMQELGLAALEEHALTDFDLVCDDGRKIGCSRRLLEERWPWFKDQRKKFAQTANSALEILPTSSMHIKVPELPGGSSADEQRPDPRLTPRSFQLSEPYPITMALVQYFYSLALLTPLQHAPAVLSQLLVLSTTYKLEHLESLVKHAMHRALSNSTSVGVYEVATLCSCRSLQIRALKTVMSYTQKKPSRTRPDKPEGGNRPPDGQPGPGGPNGSDSGGPGDSKYISRPRGTSDARWRVTEDSGNSNHHGYTSRGPDHHLHLPSPPELQHRAPTPRDDSHLPPVPGLQQLQQLSYGGARPPLALTLPPLPQPPQRNAFRPHQRPQHYQGNYHQGPYSAPPRALHPQYVPLPAPPRHRNNEGSISLQNAQDIVEVANLFNDAEGPARTRAYSAGEMMHRAQRHPPQAQRMRNVPEDVYYPSASSSSSASESEFDPFSDDNYDPHERSYLSPHVRSRPNDYHQPYPSVLPLPGQRRMRRPLTAASGTSDDSPSLMSSTSYSSLSSSTTVSYGLATPSTLSPPPEYLDSQHLGMISERHPEEVYNDYELGARLRRPGSLDSLQLQGTITPKDHGSGQALTASNINALGDWPKQKSNIHWVSRNADVQQLAQSKAQTQHPPLSQTSQQQQQQQHQHSEKKDESEKQGSKSPPSYDTEKQQTSSQSSNSTTSVKRASSDRIRGITTTDQVGQHKEQGAISRFLGRKKGGDGTVLPLTSKTTKADEKRRKKDEEKARREKLALELRQHTFELAQMEMQLGPEGKRKLLEHEATIYGNSQGLSLGMGFM